MTDRPTVDAAMCVQEVADALHVSRIHVNRLTQSLNLPFARQVGRSWVYWPEDVDAIRSALRTTEVVGER